MDTKFLPVDASTQDIEETNRDRNALAPNRPDISAHLYALFDPLFVGAYPDGWIEIPFGRPDGKLNMAGNFTVFELEQAAAFAVAKNTAGYNVYVGAAIRQGERPASGRANGDHVVTASHAWADYDGAGDDERIKGLLKATNLTPAIVVTTGETPHLRRHVYFKLAGAITPEKLEAANTSLMTLLGSDAVQNADRVMRLAGTVSYPKPDKITRGYVTELTALRLNKEARAYSPDELMELTGVTDGLSAYAAEPNHGPGRTDAELVALLKASLVRNWHNNIRDAVATMVGRGMSDSAINIACAAYCEGETQDTDLKVLIDTARKTFNKRNVELPVEGNAANESDIDRLNKVHAVLPIGGKTRVVTFGELPDFPGRETIVMVQTFGDFTALQNRYRHTYRDKKGELQSMPLGTHWIASAERRQFDGGMAFMPQHDDKVVGNRLNLWNGFGVMPIKPAGTSGAAGCRLFLDFMREVICSGNEEHFAYLLRREATIFQKRIRSEIAVGLRTEEEGCGKGFYEKTMGHLLGHHAMQISNPKHIVGAFNPHLETLLRLTADEALFVGSHEHRNALFGLITEPKLTIEPKGYSIYTADNFLNMSITSNAPHFVPVSNTARRFLIPTVSTAHMQDFEYFKAIQHQLDNGGYGALLYHLLHEVDLAGFNVRLVPQTAGLREQRDQSLLPLEAWWCELLETGTLAGADPKEPNRAVSNSYSRQIEVNGSYGTSQIRSANQLGLYDQARQIEPRLKHHTSDHRLGDFLREMGCDNKAKVLRRRGWTFPPLLACRIKWEKRYPDWQWRDAEITEWRAEEADDPVHDQMLRLVVNNEPSPEEITRLVSSGQTRF